MLAEVVSQLDGLARLVEKRRIKRQLLTQPLLDLDRVENVGQMILGRLAHALFAIGRYLGQPGQCRSQQHRRSQHQPDCAFRLHAFYLYGIAALTVGRKNSATATCERGTSGAKAQRILNHLRHD